MSESNSSRSPEGSSKQCPVCDLMFSAENSIGGDDSCPSCTELLWWFQNDSQVIQPFLESDSPLAGDSRFDSLAMDSLDVMELIMEIEDEFGVTIPDANYDKIKTFNDVIRCIQNQRQPVGPDKDNLSN